MITENVNSPGIYSGVNAVYIVVAQAPWPSIFVALRQKITSDTFAIIFPPFLNMNSALTWHSNNVTITFSSVLKQI